MLRPLILIIALGAGGGAAWIAGQKTEPEPVVVTQTPVIQEMTAVLVAGRNVSRGDQMTTDGLLWQEWPAAKVPAAFIDRKGRPNAKKELAGKFANRPISIGEPIADWALSQEANGYLAAALAPGKRAVAINVNAQSTAGGFILPNDRVDVLHTVTASRESGAVRTSTILKGVRVLAIDQTTDDPEASTVLGKTATLELTEAQVEAVTAAESAGTISLSLRPLDKTPGDASMEIVEPPKKIRIRRGTVIEDVAIN